jgi:hypothetical protein
VADPEEPGESGSIDVDVSASNSLPAARARRRRASTIGGRVVDKLEHAAESLHIPVPKTRKSRVLVRSVIVGFLVVAAWIVGIVWWQLRGASKPDLRPVAQHILEQMRAGEYNKIYAEASPRYQERVPEADFAVVMANINATLGPFKEITSITGTEVVRGPSGTSARVSMIMAFEKAKVVRGAISLHREEGTWRMLGISIELPPDIAKVESAAAKREARIEGDHAVLVDALVVLLRVQRGETAKIWDDAAPVFKTAVSKDDLAALERTRAKEIGKFVRITNVTSNHTDPTGHGDSLDLVVEYDGVEKPIVTVQFEFTRPDAYHVWQLASYKPIMPMPRVPVK